MSDLKLSLLRNKKLFLRRKESSQSAEIWATLFTSAFWEWRFFQVALEPLRDLQGLPFNARLIPLWVAIKFFLSLSTKPLWSKFSMILAQVSGFPSPFLSTSTPFSKELWQIHSLLLKRTAETEGEWQWRLQKYTL